MKPFDLEKYYHMLVIGNTGSGKTYFIERFLEQKYREGYKIIKLGEEQNMEGLGFTQITDNPQHLKYIKKMGFSDIVKPIPVEYYHPLVSSVPKDIPKMFELYTLSVKDTIGDATFLTILSQGQMSDATLTAISENVRKLEDDDSFPMLPVKIMGASDKKVQDLEGFNGTHVMFFADISRSIPSTTRILIKLKDVGMMASHKFEHNIHKKMKEILANNKITIFSTHWLQDQRIKNALNYYLLRLIADLNERKVIVFIDDAWLLFPNVRSRTDDSQKYLARNMMTLAKRIRKRGVRLVLGTQKPTDLYDKITQEIKLRVVFNVQLSISDIKEQFPGIKDMEADILANLPPRRFIVLGMQRFFNRPRGYAVNIRETMHIKDPLEEKAILNKIGTKPSQHYIDELKNDWEQTYNKIKETIDLESFKAKKTTKKKKKTEANPLSTGIPPKEARDIFRKGKPVKEEPKLPNTVKQQTIKEDKTTKVEKKKRKTSKPKDNSNEKIKKAALFLKMLKKNSSV